METEKDPFAYFDFSEEEAEKAANEISSEGYERDGRICICGHPAKRHNSFAGTSTCSPSRLVCPCKKMRAVIDTSDTRVFLRKTRGSSSLHALSQGALAAKKAGHEIEWLVDMVCDKCGSSGPIAPCAVSQQGVIMEEATGFDVLLCSSCREEQGWK